VICASAFDDAGDFLCTAKQALGRARLKKARKNSERQSVVEGHGFSHAVKPKNEAGFSR
jgi:hypothetical protein